MLDGKLLHDLSASACATQCREHLEFTGRSREYFRDEHRRCVEELIESAAGARVNLPRSAFSEVLGGNPKRVFTPIGYHEQNLRSECDRGQLFGAVQQDADKSGFRHSRDANPHQFWSSGRRSWATIVNHNLEIIRVLGMKAST
jgi:hypothetical protein